METNMSVCSYCGYDFGEFEVEWCACGTGCTCCCDCDTYEDDGQPDEMQEWADYDPDC